MAFFVTLEGIEGSGKTTQIRLLANHLQAQGLEVVCTREPGGCPIADAIRAILLDSANSAMVPRAELLLYAAARAQHVEEVIRPALAQGKVVLCDRYTDATLAYQGYGRGLDLNLIAQLNDLASGSLTPELTLLLDFPAETGLARARARNHQSQGTDEGRFEQEALDFHRRIREGYLRVAGGQARFTVIDASGDQDQVADRIALAFNAFAAQRVQR